MAGFYSDNPEACLLLGDVVVGFQSIVPQLHAPSNAVCELQISVTRPAYFAVMTPCCSIGNKQISLAPLVPIRWPFLQNPYFSEDLTRINSPVPPDKILPPAEFAKKSEAEQQRMLEKGPAYALNDCFIYAETEHLVRYEAPGKGGKIESGFYLLEFGSAFRMNCQQVIREKAPDNVKYLELSVETRSQLRQKLQHYFGRVPDEDLAALRSR